MAVGTTSFERVTGTFPVARLPGWGPAIGQESCWQGSKASTWLFRNRFEPWQVPFKRQRKEDELLVYLHQARHADQHTVEPTMIEFLGGFQLKIPPGGTVNMRGRPAH